MKKIFLILILLSVPHLSISMNQRSLGRPKPLVGIKKPILGQKINIPSITKSIIQSLNSSLWYVATIEDVIKSLLSDSTKTFLLTQAITMLRAVIVEMKDAGKEISNLKEFDENTKNELINAIREINLCLINDMRSIEECRQSSRTMTKDFVNHIAQYKEEIVDIWERIALKDIFLNQSRKQIPQNTKKTPIDGKITTPLNLPNQLPCLKYLKQEKKKRKKPT